jgi:hypothetical protein
MGIKFTGSTLLWVVAIVAGLTLAREYLRGRLVAMLEDTTSYAVFPESEPISGMDFDKPLDFTLTEPILPKSYYYQPGQ